MPAHDVESTTHDGAPYPRSDDADAARATTTFRWAIGVLTLATVALVAFMVALAMFVWMVLAVFDPGGTDPFDVWIILKAIFPVILVGWCAGLAAATVLCRGDVLGPRMSGVVAGSLGVGIGALVLLLSA